MSGMRCVLCDQPIELKQSLIVGHDGRVEHVNCPRPAAVMAEPICPACSSRIAFTEEVVRDGADVLHARCAVKRPIAGGSSATPWAVIAEEQLGRRWGRTRSGHREFITACAETLVVTGDTIARARRVISAARAARRRSVAAA
jgi:hypothetical protein